MNRLHRLFMRLNARASNHSLPLTDSGVGSRSLQRIQVLDAPAQVQQFLGHHLEVAADAQDVGVMAGTLIVQFKDQMRCQAGGRGAAMALIHLLKIPRPVQKIDQYRLQESIDVGVVPSHGLFLVDFNPRDRARWVMVFSRLTGAAADWDKVRKLKVKSEKLKEKARA
jgi:hypothetical protein